MKEYNPSYNSSEWEFTSPIHKARAIEIDRMVSLGIPTDSVEKILASAYRYNAARLNAVTVSDSDPRKAEFQSAAQAELNNLIRQEYYPSDYVNIGYLTGNIKRIQLLSAANIPDPGYEETYIKPDNTTGTRIVSSYEREIQENLDGIHYFEPDLDAYIAQRDYKLFTSVEEDGPNVSPLVKGDKYHNQLEISRKKPTRSFYYADNPEIIAPNTIDTQYVGRNNGELITPLVLSENGEKTPVDGTTFSVRPEKINAAQGTKKTDRRIVHGNFDAGAGNDRLSSGDNQARIFGGSGNDTVIISTKHKSNQNTVVHGGAGDDYLRGGAGNDILVGDGQNSGRSIAQATAGSNTFELSKGHDIVVGTNLPKLEGELGTIPLKPDWSTRTMIPQKETISIKELADHIVSMKIELVDVGANGSGSGKISFKTSDGVESSTTFVGINNITFKNGVSFSPQYLYDNSKDGAVELGRISAK